MKKIDIQIVVLCALGLFAAAAYAASMVETPKNQPRPIPTTESGCPTPTPYPTPAG